MNYNEFYDPKLSIRVITDTHFGRVWKDGVPLDRRGEYEKRILNSFDDVLMYSSAKNVIHAGDLFESPFVNNETLFKVYMTIRRALDANKETQYYFIAGNHDLSKNKEQKDYTSFHILKELLWKYDNITFIEDCPITQCIGGEKILMVPYSHFESIDDVLTKSIGEDNPQHIIGHFEEPVCETLSKFTGMKLSGHIHKKHITFDGTIYIGSFYPIAFGEESDNSTMETMTLEEYNKRGEDDLKDKRIRILLKDGEELPTDHPCLQLIAKKEVTETPVNLEVTLNEDFDFRSLFFKCTEKSEISDELWIKYNELKGSE